jgi:hypothetical protein
MGVAQGFGEDHTRPNPHWADGRARLTFTLDDLAALVRRWRYPRKGQCSILTVLGNGVAHPYLVRSRRAPSRERRALGMALPTPSSRIAASPPRAGKTIARRPPADAASHSKVRIFARPALRPLEHYRRRAWRPPNETAKVVLVGNDRQELVERKPFLGPFGSLFCMRATAGAP